jgi:orotate phosphoribosyltransferase/AMMECR1 domain-containing protein
VSVAEVDRCTARAELLDLLCRDAILRRSADQPVLSRDGTSARWMLDSLAVTLTPRGAELAARALLEVLESFEGRQLATLGLTGVPLLQGCVLHGGGRYSGMLVRKERKAHGSLKLIEGRLDRSEPVVMVDDSVSSGQSMLTCAQRLEEAGFHVEGGVCLVHFGYERGMARMVARGYRAAAVYDIFTDFMPHIDGERPPPVNPTTDAGPLDRSPQQAADGLHPAHLAREVMAEYLRSGQVLRAPRELDRAYPAAGGCWVSVRRRTNVHDRPARDGFWRFPGEAAGPASDGVVLAAIRTAAQLARAYPDPAAVLHECGVAVTFFGALQECTVGELDNDRYGIVVRSRERPGRMGGALPRMPGIATDWAQYAHAAFRNARLLPGEAHHLYRHDVHKVVEPGAAWQPTGVPVTDGPDPDRGVAEAAARRVLDLVRAEGSRQGGAIVLPEGTAGAFVTVYADGRLAGCAGVFGDDCGRRLPECVTAAVHDGRFPRATGTPTAVALSLLSHRHEIGVADPDWVVRPVRFADQALAVRQGERFGFVLPSVAVTHDLTPRQYVAEVIDKAGITRPPYRWTRYDCATWLADASGVRPTRHGLPVGAPAPTAALQVRRLRELLRRYAARHHVGPDQPYGVSYDVFADRVHAGAHPARTAYGAWALARAGLPAAAVDDLARPELQVQDGGWLGPDGSSGSIAEPAFAVLAHLELGTLDATTAQLASALLGRIDGHGRFATHRDPGAAQPAFQDYAPGQALLALAAAARAGLLDARSPAVERALRHYRMRFRQNRAWGAVSWLAQAYAAWGALLDDPVITAVAFEVADRAVPHQSLRTGGFLNDHQRDAPGATTALYLEGIAAARAAAERLGDAAREARYRAVCARGVGFLDELVYQERDAAVLPNPEWAVGGLRTAPTAGAVRLDYVHHALCAVSALEGVVA